MIPFITIQGIKASTPSLAVLARTGTLPSATLQSLPLTPIFSCLSLLPAPSFESWHGIDPQPQDVQPPLPPVQPLFQYDPPVFDPHFPFPPLSWM
jgi:hypothetical protein